MGGSTIGSLGVGTASITETKESHCYKWKNTHTLLFCDKLAKLKHAVTLIKFNTSAVNWHCCTHSIISMPESLSQYSSVLFHIPMIEWRMWATDLGDDVLDSEQSNMNEVYAKLA